MGPKLSAYMLTCNNERTVATAIAGLKFADEIVVVDSGSKDQTLALVKPLATRVLHHPWPGFEAQYQWAQEQCAHEWVLFLDADEELTPALAKEIRAALTANAQRAPALQLAGFVIPRRTFYVDRWIQHGGWAKDREIRLWRRERGHWAGGLHAKVRVDGTTEALSHPIYHYTYESISDQVQTVDSYSTGCTADLVAAGKRCSLLHLIGNPLVRFFSEYILQQGFRDGIPGLVIAVTTAYYVFLKHAKLWEYHRIREVDVAAHKAQKPGLGE